MTEQERDDVYCDVQDKHWLDLQCCENEPWVSNDDGSWSKRNESNGLSLTITPEGLYLQSDTGFKELYRK